MPLIFGAEGRRSNAFASRGELSSTQRYFGDRQALGGSCGKGRNRPDADSHPPRAAPVEMSRAQIFAYGDQSQGARSSETRGGAACPRIQPPAPTKCVGQIIKWPTLKKSERGSSP